MNTLTNKVALITGSARGTGKAIAERYGSLRASVVVNYRVEFNWFSPTGVQSVQREQNSAALFRGSSGEGAG